MIIRTFPFFVLTLMAASKASDDSLVFSLSPHDVRLKEMVRLLSPIKYTDLTGEHLARPEKVEIISSLLEREKCTCLTLSVYNELFAATKEKFKEGGMYGTQRSKEFLVYLQDQFDANNASALALKKVNVQAFRADILLMLRIASSGKPETLSKDLQALYEQQREPQMESYYGLKHPNFLRTFTLDEIIGKRDEEIKEDLRQNNSKPIKGRRAD